MSVDKMVGKFWTSMLQKQSWLASKGHYASETSTWERRSGWLATKGFWFSAWLSGLNLKASWSSGFRKIAHSGNARFKRIDHVFDAGHECGYRQDPCVEDAKQEWSVSKIYLLLEKYLLYVGQKGGHRVLLRCLDACEYQSHQYLSYFLLTLFFSHISHLFFVFLVVLLSPIIGKPVLPVTAAAGVDPLD